MLQNSGETIVVDTQTCSPELVYVDCEDGNQGGRQHVETDSWCGAESINAREPSPAASYNAGLRVLRVRLGVTQRHLELAERRCRPGPPACHV